MHHLGVSGSWSRKYLESVERLFSDILQSALARQRQEGLTLGEMLHFPLCKAEQGSRRLLLSQLATVCGEDKIGEVQVFGYHHLDFPKSLLHIPMLYYYYLLLLFLLRFKWVLCRTCRNHWHLLQGAALWNMNIPWSIDSPRLQRCRGYR